MSGTLYVVATPIGNLEDITFRAVRVLGEVSTIGAEDTRLSRRLLAHYAIETPLFSLHQHSGPSKLASVVARLASGDDIAIITDGGTPAISDPGGEMVRAAQDAHIRVIPIPGPSALTAAISAAGMRAQRFHFLGFCPRKPGERKKLFANYVDDEETLVLYESPYRAAATLTAAYEALGERRVVVCRELTKRFEEIIASELSEAAERVRATEQKGEFVMVIEGAGR